MARSFYSHAVWPCDELQADQAVTVVQHAQTSTLGAPSITQVLS